MTETLKIWWRTRSLREQRLLLAMLALLTAVFLWLLIIRPLGDALSRARERHGAAVLAVAEARAQAASITGLQASTPAAPTGPIDTMLNQSATEAGFTVSQLQPEGPNQATITMATVRPPAFFGWISQMEGRGLVVQRMSATTNSDQTLSVQVTFRGRSAQ